NLPLPDGSMMLLTTGGWRIPKIMRRSASDIVHDSAVATHMSRALPVCFLHQAQAAGLPSPRARDACCNNPGNRAVSFLSLPPSRIVCGLSTPGELSRLVSPQMDAIVEHKVRF